MKSLFFALVCALSFASCRSYSVPFLPAYAVNPLGIDSAKIRKDNYKAIASGYYTESGKFIHSLDTCVNGLVFGVITKDTSTAEAKHKH